MTRNTDFSLTHVSLSSVTWFASVLVGWSLVATAIVKIATNGAVVQPAALFMVSGLLVLLELLPLVLGRGHDPQGIVMSTAFMSAMMFVWGVWPAVLVIAVASLTSDLRARKAWWKTAFNPAQYSVSVAASYLVLQAWDTHPTLSHPLPHFHVDDVVWAAGTWIVYYVVNLLLVVCVLSFRGSFVRLLQEDLVHGTAITFAVLAMSPLVAVVAITTWELLPLLLVPLLLLYYTNQMSLKREYDASHDPLTGLGNRASMHFDLDAALASYRQDAMPFGLIMIDLDDFKMVNDTLGHHVGDELLREFSARLAECMRTSDRVARLGGDEFAVIVFEAEEGEVRAVADRIQESIAHSVELSEISLELDVSVGIAVCPAHGEDAATLMRRADVAMYTAKENRTLVEVYASDRDRNSANRLALLGELRGALNTDDVELAYQPKVSAADGSLLGVEALIRWRHAVRGFVPPDEFIPLAERSGIMPLVTERVVRLALAQVARWRDAGVEVPVAVNIAPTDLAGDWLAVLIESVLAEHCLPAKMLRLEITERTVVNGTAATSGVLERLHDIGVTISLDDFGTGYSSLLRLSELPVDEIKIDRVFVARLSEGGQAAGIVKALIDLAHARGVPAIGEGVETEIEFDLLAAMGCDGIQGWHVAHPMPIHTATLWLFEHQASHGRPVRREPVAITGDPLVHLGVRDRHRTATESAISPVPVGSPLPSVGR